MNAFEITYGNGKKEIVVNEFETVKDVANAYFGISFGEMEEHNAHIKPLGEYDPEKHVIGAIEPEPEQAPASSGDVTVGLGGNTASSDTGIVNT